MGLLSPLFVSFIHLISIAIDLLLMIMLLHLIFHRRPNHHLIPILNSTQSLVQFLTDFLQFRIFRFNRQILPDNVLLGLLLLGLILVKLMLHSLVHLMF